MDYILNLIFLLVAAKLFGEASERVGFPSVLGYILAGVIAGPMLLNLAGPADIAVFAELGIILMLFVTGFQQGNVDELMKDFPAIMRVSLLGFIFPFIAALIVGFAFSIPLDYLLLLALIVSATDSGITIRSIASVNMLATRAGKIMLGVTVSDGMMGLIAFTAVITYLRIGGIDLFEIASVIAMIAVFMGMFLAMQRVVPWLVEKIEHLSVEQAEFSFAFVFMIAVGLLAEQFGLHGIVGAFLAGTLLARSEIGKSQFINKISSISYAIFIPLFFVWTGLLLNLGDITLMSFVLVFGALAANAIGAYWASKMNGMNENECVMTALTMLPRGDVNLIIASIGVTLLDLNGNLVLPQAMGELFYSSAMLLVIMAALITFVGLKLFVKPEGG